MKIRTGFVSNSSSSSFICVVCGRAEGGMDMGLDDAEMCQCENGHQICYEHLPDLADPASYGYDLPAKRCPCCNFHYVTDKALVSYFLKSNNITREEAAKMFREKFQSFDAFEKYINENSL